VAAGGDEAALINAFVEQVSDAISKTIVSDLLYCVASERAVLELSAVTASEAPHLLFAAMSVIA
jgi:hypothetical protein